jgi:hypothetical protein
MPNQTITFTAPLDKHGQSMTISLELANDKVVSLVAHDSKGREFAGCFSFVLRDKEDPGKPTICCCCIDNDGNVLCTSGPCHRR